MKIKKKQTVTRNLLLEDIVIVTARSSLSSLSKMCQSLTNTSHTQLILVSMVMTSDVAVPSLPQRVHQVQFHQVQPQARPLRLLRSAQQARTHGFQMMEATIQWMKERFKPTNDGQMKKKQSITVPVLLKRNFSNMRRSSAIGKSYLLESTHLVENLRVTQPHLKVVVQTLRSLPRKHRRSLLQVKKK